MAISYTCSLVTTLAGETPIVLSPGVQTIAKSAKGVYSDYKTITTSPVTLSSTTLKGQLTTAGLCFVRNCDSTNFVSVGSATGAYNQKVLAGESYVFRLSGSDCFLAADTASVDIQWVVLEN